MQTKTKAIMFVMAILILVAIPMVSAWCFLGVGTTCEATSLAYNERTDWEEIKERTTADVTTTCYKQVDKGTKHSIYCDRVSSKDGSYDFYSYFKIANTKSFKITEIQNITHTSTYQIIDSFKEVECPKGSFNETKGLKCNEAVYKNVTNTWYETKEVPLALSKEGTYDYKLDSKVVAVTSKVKTYKIEWEDEAPVVIQTVMQGTKKEGSLSFPSRGYYSNELKINPIISYNSTDANWGGVASNSKLDVSGNITAVKSGGGSTTNSSTFGTSIWYDDAGGTNRAGKVGVGIFVKNSIDVVSVKDSASADNTKAYILDGADNVVATSGAGSGHIFNFTPHYTLNANTHYYVVLDKEGTGRNLRDVNYETHFPYVLADANIVVGRYDNGAGGTNKTNYWGDFYSFDFEKTVTAPVTYSTSGNRTLDGFCPDYPKKYDWSNATLTSWNSGANIGNMTLKFADDNTTWADETPYADLQMIKKNAACIQMIPNVTTAGSTITPLISEAGVTYKSTNAPDLAIASPTNTTYTTTTIDLNYSAYDFDGISLVWYSINDTANVSLSGNTSVNFPIGNTKLTVYANDTENNMNQTEVHFTTSDVAPPIFDSITYLPEVLNLSVIFDGSLTGGHFHVNSTITDGSGVNQSKTRLYSWVNSSTLTTCYTTNNGTSAPRRCPLNTYTQAIIINSTKYEWALTGDEVFESVNNINRDIYNTPHNTVALAVNSRVRTRFLGVPTTNIDSLVFELMADNTSATSPPLQTVACNSSYASGSVLTSPNCLTIGSFTGLIPYNHIHSTNSKHRMLEMAVMNGKINGLLQLTSNMSFIMLANSGWNIYNVPNNTNSAFTGNNHMTSWTQQTYTIDGHLHPQRSGTKLYFKIEACDNYGNCANSTTTQITETPSSLRPTNPSIFTPTEFTNISKLYSITWLNSTSYNDGQNGINYTIRLFNVGTNIFNFTIVDNTTYDATQLIHSYPWNSALATSGMYELRIRATDTAGLFTIATVRNVTIDNEAASIPLLNAPTNNSRTFFIPNVNWTNSNHLFNRTITYALEVDTDHDFGSIDYQNYPITETTTLTGDTPTGLAIDNTFFWRVKSVVQSGLFNSSYSEVRAFNYSSGKPFDIIPLINSTSPLENYTNASINCIFKPLSERYTTLYANVTWWIEPYGGDYIRNITYVDIPVTNDTQYVDQMNYNNTHRFDNIKCEVSISDGTYSSSPINSSSIEVRNHIPTVPQPTSPSNGTTIEAWVNTLRWINSTEIDNDNLTYWVYWDAVTNPPTTLLQANTSNSSIAVSTSNNENYWRVRAYDGFNYSAYSNTWMYVTDNTTGRSNVTTLYPFIYEGDKKYFEVNVTVNNVTVGDVTQNGFKLNNTLYTLTKTKINDTDYNFGVTVNAPVYTINNPETKVWFFNVTYNHRDATNEEAIISGSSGISRSHLYICDKTYNNTYLNYTFKDETSGLYMNGTLNTGTFTYSLNSDMSGSKVLIFTNNSILDSYPFCFDPMNRTVYTTTALAYSNSPLYPQRNSAETLTLTNATTNRTLYLASTSVGVYSTFTVTNVAFQFISGVNINVERDFAGTFINIVSGNTDDTGKASFWLDPNYAHRLTFTKTGYTTYVMTINPISSNYDIVLSTTTVTPDYNFYRGISFAIEPNVMGLKNATSYDFKFAINSSYWSLSGAGFTLDNQTATLGSATCVGATSCIATTTYNTGNNSKICMNYYWTVTGNTTRERYCWKVSTSGSGASSMDNLIEDITILGSSFGGGTDASFTKSFIALLLIIAITGIVTYISGQYSPLAIIGEVFVLTWFFDLVGFLANPVGAIPHFIPIMIGVVGLGYLIYDNTR